MPAQMIGANDWPSCATSRAVSVAGRSPLSTVRQPPSDDAAALVDASPALDYVRLLAESGQWSGSIRMKEGR
jgi:hypothetical protein